MNPEGHPLPRERFHPRVDAGLMVKLELAGRQVLVKARDLSMAGVFLLGHRAALGERLRVTLPLPEDREILTGAIVRRRAPDGVAVEFDLLDWEDLFALARFLHPRLP
jgi:hypothetical protein